MVGLTPLSNQVGASVGRPPTRLCRACGWTVKSGSRNERDREALDTLALLSRDSRGARIYAAGDVGLRGGAVERRPGIR